VPAWGGASPAHLQMLSVHVPLTQTAAGVVTTNPAVAHE
jgi:hypothetical protein